ncbi:PLP-dependent cysteine synthase family protein [Planotetraspora kaengkrachanensis]|uniref:Putative cysteine synthase A CysK2 n=1 Tax=Planotetraspora kaengkrachanensis TaxID=575193 RepID=A0A8J3LVZ7_9ACTN|nr:putative cysteine synthase A CysK2 [Planotetraspora kaengkrachanensis]
MTIHAGSPQVRSPERATSSAAVIGNTPTLYVDQPFVPDGRGFWAKLEGFNPGGIKDRAALHVIHQARIRGELPPGGVIVESTSGTFGLGLALAGAVYRHPVTLVADVGLEPIMRQMLQAYGARVEIVDRPHPRGGWQQARRDRVAELMRELPGSYWPDQYNNPDLVEAYAGLAGELAERFPRIDVLVCSVGTGAHSSGIHRALRRSFPGLRLVGVDAVGSTIFGQPPRDRLMRGLGSSIHPRNVAYDAFREVHWVGPAEAVWACRRLAAGLNISGGWSTGAVALVARWLAGTLSADRVIVAVFPDGPWRYWDTVYSDDYCSRHDLLATPADEPDEVGNPGEREVTRWTRCRVVTDPLERIR